MTNSTKSKKSAIAIAAVLVVSVALGITILRSGKPAPEGNEHGHGHAESAAHADAEHHDQKAEDKHAHEAGHDDEEHHEDPGQDTAPAKGPHGGKLFVQDGFGLELTIFETGAEPEFRVYLFNDGKPVAPSQAQVAVTLKRLGRPAELFSFAQQQDYLKGSATVEEPHSFKAAIKAQAGIQTYEFKFEQVEGRVQMTDEQLQRNGVELGDAGPARIRSSLQLLGEVKLNQDRSVFVTPRLAGIVESVRANAGDRVRRGQVLAVISSQALADQRGELLAAQKRLNLARTTYEREKKLWEDKISAEQDYLTARQLYQEAEIATESARQKMASLGAGTTESTQGLTRYEVRAPIDGVITDKKISVGEVLKEDSTVFQLADLSTVWVELIVPAKDVGRLKVGDQARVQSAALEGEASAKVSYVSALIGEQSRNATARLVLGNAKGQWRPGLPVSVDLTSDEVAVPVAVAADAVQTLGKGPVVFGRYGQQFEARPLELGRSDGRFTEVVKGLSSGERYAAKNSFLIKAELGKAGASHDH
ncbi:membrane fusion protein, cobalt-zinc-cadmium efflux system [Oryzisolibacter propanilivorax]|uniref:Membrane fusion protein, cobalt-zinc-cadmium efflux system n=1 Tax=Oryzisolibacter propanilivorax TaxID=1527607 RepID=A0A1G9TWU8_9BURK|nr:efflux RND transporter periplasmic adaptor subunit [Oryzisolibacter propanilivorax]SDM51745.1 membrane fusion protein, cobalt-zinc-cadmium efflux system [Oryzisolibacter propanilivorax]